MLNSDEVNSLVPGRCGSDLKNTIFKFVIQNTRYEIAFE